MCKYLPVSKIMLKFVVQNKGIMKFNYSQCVISMWKSSAGAAIVCF